MQIFIKIKFTIHKKILLYSTIIIIYVNMNLINRRTVIQDTTWDTFKRKNTFEKINSMVKWTADAILTEEQVKSWYYYSRDKLIIKLNEEKVRENSNMYANLENFSDKQSLFYNSERALFVSNQTRQNNSFSYISNKKEIIDENIKNIISEIEETWKISSNLKKDILLTYIDNSYLSIDIVNEAILDYFKKETKRVYNKANSPLITREYWWESKIIQEYHDIDHDLLEEEKQILAYWLKNCFLNVQEFNKIEQILKMWWDDLYFFYTYNYRSHLIKIYLEKILNK